jgi:hypothetical protein
MLESPVAIISVAELIRVVRMHPSYWSDIYSGVDSETALRVRFAQANGNHVARTEIFEAVDGRELMLGFEADGRIRFMEIS